MKNLLKIGTVALSTAMALSMLTGCGGASSMPGAPAASSDASGAPAASAEASQQTTGKDGKRQFNFWDSAFKTDLESNIYLKTAIDLFQKQHPDVEFVLSTKGRPEQQFDALTIAFSSDNGPDAFGYSVGSLMSPLIESGKIENLNTLFEENKWKDVLDPATIKMQEMLFDGNMYALPIEHTVMGVFYRKDLYEKYGLKVPTTFEEFENNCKVLQENGIVPIGNAGKVPAVTNRWFDGFLEMRCGPELHDKLLTGEAPINSPEVVAALEDLKKLSGYFQNGHLSAEESEVYMLLYPGKAAHFYTATWQADTFENQEQSVDDYGYFRFPSGQTPSRSNSFSYGVYVNASSPNKDLAEDFLKICASLEPYKAAFEQKKSIVGARPDAFDPSKVDDLRKALLEDIGNEGGSYMPSNEMSWPPKLTDELFQVLDQVMLDEITPAQGAEQLDAMAKEIAFYKSAS